MRHALLDGAFKRIGGALDIDQLAREFVNIIVPHFANAAGLLMLESLVGGDELPMETPDGSHLLRRLAVAYDDGDPGWDAAFPTGEILRYPRGTPYTRCMDSGKPVREVNLGDDNATRIATSWLRRPVARLLSGASMLLLPLIARDVTLGFFVCTRQKRNRRFDAYDTETGMEFAARAAIFIDNARRYSRERPTALTLQRSRLPRPCSSSMSSCRNSAYASRISPPASTGSSTRCPARWRSRRPAICCRCSSARMTRSSSSTSRPHRRSASAPDPSRADLSRSTMAACLCSTPTGWWRT